MGQLVANPFFGGKAAAHIMKTARRITDYEIMRIIMDFYRKGTIYLDQSDKFRDIKAKACVFNAPYC